MNAHDKQTASGGEATPALTGTHHDALDGLRGLAILLVMMYHFVLPHAGSHGNDAAVPLQLAMAGWMGVDLFFVLSGFLITGILVETREHPHYFKNFLGRRFLRIWPLYYASLVVLLVIMPMVLPSIPPELQGMRDKQAWFWLYAANWMFAIEGGLGKTSGGYFWSLAVEEQFYLVWPFVVYLLSPRALLRTSLALLAFSLVSRIVLVNLGVSTGSLYTMTFTHLDGLAVGACLALCARSPALAVIVSRRWPAVALIALAGMVAVRWSDQNLFLWSRGIATYGYTLIAVLFGVLLWRVLHAGPGTPLHSTFTNGFMRQCGKYSYALYMVHVPVASLLFPIIFKVAKRFAPDLNYEIVFLAFAAVAFAASWMLAVASWHLFEKRILSLKRYFSYADERPGPRPATAPH